MSRVRRVGRGGAWIASPVRARSSVGQSGGLIIRWSLVRVQAGPLQKPRSTRFHNPPRAAAQHGWQRNWATWLAVAATAAVCAAGASGAVALQPLTLTVTNPAPGVVDLRWSNVPGHAVVIFSFDAGVGQYECETAVRDLGLGLGGDRQPERDREPLRLPGVLDRGAAAGLHVSRLDRGQLGETASRSGRIVLLGYEGRELLRGHEAGGGARD